MNAAAWGRSRELCKDIDEDDDEAENSYCNSPIFIPLVVLSALQAVSVLQPVNMTFL